MKKKGERGEGGGMCDAERPQQESPHPVFHPAIGKQEERRETERHIQRI